MLKKSIVFFLVILMVVTPVCMGVVAQETQNEIKVMIDGKVQQYDQSPVIVNNRTLVPLQGIFEALGAEVRLQDGKEQVLHVKDFGAVGDGVNNDGPAIQKAVEVANATEGRKKIVFDNKTYRLGDRADSWHWFLLDNAKNVTVEGNGAVLLFTKPTNNAFSVTNSENIKIRGLTIDYEELPFTQGEITSVNRETGSFDMCIQDGYDLPPTNEWMMQNHLNRNDTWWFGMVFSANEKFVKRGIRDHQMIASVNQVEGRTYRVELREAYRKDLNGIVPGDRFVIRYMFKKVLSNEQCTAKKSGYPNGTLCFMANKNIVVEDLTIHTTLQMGIVGRQNEGDMVFRRVKFLRKPGTDNLVSGLSDGIHIKGNRVSPIIEECVFDGMCDDSINVGAEAYCFVKEVYTDSELLMEGKEEKAEINRIGDLLMFFDRKNGRVLGEASITNIEFVDTKNNPKLYKVTLDRPVIGIVAGGSDNKESTAYWNLNVADAGFVIRNNYFTGGRRYAALIKAMDGVMENNILKDRYGIVLSFNSTTTCVGPIPRNVIIRGNEFINITQYGIGILPMNALTDITQRFFGNITIENNKFEKTSPAVQTVNAKNIKIKNNTIGTGIGNYAIRLVQSEGIEIDGLNVTDERPEMKAVISVEACGENAVTVKNENIKVSEGIPVLISN